MKNLRCALYWTMAWLAVTDNFFVNLFFMWLHIHVSSQIRRLDRPFHFKSLMLNKYRTGEAGQHSWFTAVKLEQLDSTWDPQLMSNVKHHVEPRSASQAQWALSAFKPEVWSSGTRRYQITHKNCFFGGFTARYKYKKSREGDCHKSCLTKSSKCLLNSTEWWQFLTFCEFLSLSDFLSELNCFWHCFV